MIIITFIIIAVSAIVAFIYKGKYSFLKNEIYFVVGTVCLLLSWFLQQYWVQPYSDRIVETKYYNQQYLSYLNQLSSLRLQMMFTADTNILHRDTVDIQFEIAYTANGIAYSIATMLNEKDEGLLPNPHVESVDSIQKAFDINNDSIDLFYQHRDFLKLANMYTKLKRIRLRDQDAALSNKNTQYNLYQNKRDEKSSQASVLLWVGTILVGINRVTKYISEYFSNKKKDQQEEDRNAAIDKILDKSNRILAAVEKIDKQKNN